jgi:signal transduction histidine kinase
MVASITHEINTPLGSSLIAATTLRDRAAELSREIAAGSVRRSSLEKFLAECGEATGILERNLERAGTLMASFKHVAVDQTGAGRREFLLDELVHDVMLTLSPSFKRLPVRFAEEIPPGIRMNSYPGALGQVLANLVQNAVVHGLEGRDQGEVRVTAESLPKRALVRVSDNGNGIAPQNMGRIFEPFFTTKAGRGGSGLGLHICRKLVSDVLRGTIEVHSAPGAGATFSLDLPLDPPVDGSDSRKAGSAAEAMPAAEAGPMHAQSELP